MESLAEILKKLTLGNTFGDTDTSYAEDKPNTDLCTHCEGRGWVRANAPLNHPDFGKAIPCSCQAQATYGQRLTRLQRYSNLGNLTRLTMNSLDSMGRSTSPQDQRRFHEAYQASSEYAEDPQGWMVFTGPVGSGKTHLLAAIVNRCLDSEIPAFYISVPDLLDHLRSTYAPNSETTYDQLFDHVRNAPILALDDLGSHATTPWAQEKLNQILNHRFNRMSPTIIALSLPINNLDEPLRARLEDKSQVLLVNLGDNKASSNWRLDRIKFELMRKMTFGNFDMNGNRADTTGRETLERALNSAKVFAESPSGWIVLTGVTGSGKTHLAVSIVNERTQNGDAALFAFVPDLLDYLRFTFSPQSPVTYDQFFEEIRTSPLLILDDLGSQSSTPWAEEKLYQIIVYRQEARLPTVITVRGFIEDLPEAVQSRLKDVNLVTLVPITAPDYRDSGRHQGYKSRTQRRGR